MAEDEDTKDLLPSCGHQKKTDSECSCQLSCGTNDFSNSNPYRTVIV